MLKSFNSETSRPATDKGFNGEAHFDIFLFLVSVHAEVDGAAGLLGPAGFDLGIDLGFFRVFGGLGVVYEGLQSDVFRDDLVCGFDGYGLS